MYLYSDVHVIPFFAVYSPDMPKRLPIRDIFGGLLSSIGRAVRYWFHYTLVAFAWLGVVPLTACELCNVQLKFVSIELFVEKMLRCYH